MTQWRFHRHRFHDAAQPLWSNDTMAGEEQERFEDYVELELVIENVQAGRITHPPKTVTPEQARIYAMLMLCHTLAPHVLEPRPAFVAALQRRLQQELDALTTISAVSAENDHSQKHQLTVSRRTMLARSGVVAASLVAGAGIEHTLQQAHTGPWTAPATVPLLPTTAPATWHFVTTLADLGANVMRFTTNTIVGYVLSTTDTEQKNKEGPPQGTHIIALSAACTHMGCLVQWHDTDRHFHCPCHGGLFAENGTAVVAPGAKDALLPLPRLDTKVEHGKVYVRIPVSSRPWK